MHFGDAGRIRTYSVPLRIQIYSLVPSTVPAAATYFGPGDRTRTCIIPFGTHPITFVFVRSEGGYTGILFGRSCRDRTDLNPPCKGGAFTVIAKDLLFGAPGGTRTLNLRLRRSLLLSS